MTGPHGPVFSLYFMTRKDCIMDQTDRYAIELRGIDKRFGDVYANKQIDLQVRKGSIHGIVGENGAGKSTLMSIITVSTTPTEARC